MNLHGVGRSRGLSFSSHHNELLNSRLFYLKRTLIIVAQCFCLIYYPTILTSFDLGLQEMDTEEKSSTSKVLNTNFFVQWGNKKRLRCVRVRDPQIISQKPDGSIRRRITSKIDRFVVSSLKDSPNRVCKNPETASHRSIITGNRKPSSPEKEDRYYTTRNSTINDESTKFSLENGNCEEKSRVFPKLYITLSSKEKEEDFMAMKGCKLPQRPKKRAKIIQRSLLLVSPGAWLTDMCQERYEVREKKISKKRPRGLKAMGSMESDSD